MVLPDGRLALHLCIKPSSFHFFARRRGRQGRRGMDVGCHGGVAVRRKAQQTDNGRDVACGVSYLSNINASCLAVF